MLMIAIFNLTFISYASTKNLTMSVVLKKENGVAQFDVRIPKDSNIAALNFEVTYDSSVLEYASYESTDIYNSGINQINDTQEGKIICAYISPTSVVKGGSFLVLKFRVNNVTTIEKDDFNLNIKEMANTQGKTIDYEIEYSGFGNYKSSDETLLNASSSVDNSIENELSNQGKAEEREDVNDKESIQDNVDVSEKNIINSEIEDNLVENQLTERKRSYKSIHLIEAGVGVLLVLVIVIIVVNKRKKKERKR